MDHFFIIAQAPSQPSFLVSLMPLVLIFGIFYVIVFMPMRKKQKALDELLKALKKGDKVVTTGGIYGQIVKAEGLIVVLQVADNVRIRVAKRAIAGLEGSPEDKGDR